mgnify:CR=1 FL=1
MTPKSIFISSVQKEFADERRAVKAFVEGDPLLRRYFTVFLFEDLPAHDRRADEVYLGKVDRCALYVGLFGQATDLNPPQSRQTRHEARPAGSRVLSETKARQRGNKGDKGITPRLVRRRRSRRTKGKGSKNP